MLRKFIFGTSAGLADLIYLALQLGLAIHLFTTYLAFQVSGFTSAHNIRFHLCRNFIGFGIGMLPAYFSISSPNGLCCILLPSSWGTY